MPKNATIYIKNKNKFNNAVGATNNLRGLSAKVEFIEDILPQNSEKSSGNAKYSLSPAELDKQYLLSVKNNDVEFARANVMYRVGENGYVADVLVGIRENGATVLYDLVNIYGKEITEASVTMASDKIDSQCRQNASVNDILPRNYKKSSGNAKYSLSPAELDKQYLSAVKNNDNGNVIPLSERFKKDNNDIRYSLNDNLENVEKILYDNNNPLAIVNRAKAIITVV